MTYKVIFFHGFREAHQLEDAMNAAADEGFELLHILHDRGVIIMGKVKKLG